MSPRITLVVITRDRRQELATTLAHHAASVPGADLGRGLVYVDNASTDGTSALIQRRLPEATVIRLTENIGAAARNVGVAWSPTRYVAFSDDDSWWAPGALEVAGDLLDRKPGLGLVTGATLVGPGERPDPINVALEQSPLPRIHGGVAVLGFLACAAVVRRDALLGVGGFPRGVEIGGEEELLALDLASAGWDLIYRPDLVAHHHPGVSGPRPGREGAMERNGLIYTLARRRGSTAAIAAVRLMRSGLGRSGAVRPAQLVGLGAWALANRRPVSWAVEERARALERR